MAVFEDESEWAGGTACCCAWEARWRPAGRAGRPAGETVLVIDASLAFVGQYFVGSAGRRGERENRVWDG